jgi:DNA end-binding protein Ku
MNMLHSKCGSRLRQQYVCTADEEVVPRNEIVKGYEYAKGQYVLFSEEELKALNREATNSIDITEFIPLSEIDPIYFEKSYYVGPGKGGDRPYRLLAEAMRSTGRAALASYAARGKDYLVLLRPYENGLILQQLRYADEVRPFSEVPVGQSELKEPELRLAVQLIDQIAVDSFRPEAYEDTVKKQTKELIERKVRGEEIVVPAAEAPKAQIIDLMAALKASLAAPATPEESAAAKTALPKPATLAGRKPAKPSPRPAAAQAEPVAAPAAVKKRGSKR